MTAATTTKPSTSARKVGSSKISSRYSSTQARFATSKLIQNLGSSNQGAQFSFNGSLRTAHGRD